MFYLLSVPSESQVGHCVLCLPGTVTLRAPWLFPSLRRKVRSTQYCLDLKMGTAWAEQLRT